MKISRGVVLVLALTGALNAEEVRSGVVVPQPRVRLDPTHRTMMAEPQAKQPKVVADPVVAMSPFIVRSTPVESLGPQEPSQPTGPFSPVAGGWIGRKEVSEMRIEVGAWPYRNILWKVDRFKSDPKHVGTEFARMSW